MTNYHPAAHLSGLCGGSQTRMNSIKLANCHHARVYLVVELQGENRDQHGVQMKVACPDRSRLGYNDPSGPTGPADLCLSKRVLASLM